MRTGICSIHLQALTPEAATLVKQAVNLATRRGHSQVTPLHVASVMLSTPNGLLHKACLQCHSHPLQFKALELCFNVSLNRLPASSSSPLLCPQYSNSPSLSNALVAAFKRAQAYQRRGSSTENQQQQHILALKIEVEQLIISILDDPSISRVMREAGFSSTLVKSRVEQAQAVSMEVCSQPSPPAPSNRNSKESTNPQVVHLGVGRNNNVSPSRSFGQFGGSFTKSIIDHVSNNDVDSALSEIVSKGRNTVVVGESLANAEEVAKGVMQRLERGNVMQFVSLPLVSFRNISKEEVERKLVELRSLVVKSYVGGGRGFVLYLGDLKWLFEFWSNYYSEQRTENYYCSVEHMVMEIKKLISTGNGEKSTRRLWLMGIATFKTYMKCKVGQYPSIETIWELHPFTIPVGSLSLGLSLDSDFQAQERSKIIFKDESFDDRAKVRKHLTCCGDCSLNFEKEAQSIVSSRSRTILKKDCTASLPTWLQNCKEERVHIMDDQVQENAKLWDICKKWNSFCSSLHGHYPSNLGKQLFHLSSSPNSSPSSSVSSHKRKSSSLHLSQLSCWPPVISEVPKEVPKEWELYTESDDIDDCYEAKLIMFMPERNNVPTPKPDLLSNPNSSPNSASSSEAVDNGLDCTQMFKELNAENLKILCDALEKKVNNPQQQREMIKEIASTVLLCRSGMRKGAENYLVKRDDKQETWMFFLGSSSVEDSHEAKELISKELAKVVFGSYSNFVSIGISSFSSHQYREEHSKNKRPRDEFGSSYLQRFGEAVNENPHRVFFMEDFEQVDYFSQKGVKQAIESGSITLPGGESVPLKDAIVIFSSERSFSRSVSATATTSPSAEINIGKENIADNLEEKITSCLSLDLNMAIEVGAHDDVSLTGDHLGILELVDKQINFKTQEL